MSPAKKVVARYKSQVDLPREASTRLTLGPGVIEQQVSRVLPTLKLKAKHQGALQDATLSAGFYAKKLNKTMYIYLGNSYMHSMWQVSYKPGDYLNPINNMGNVVYSVTPELQVFRHEVRRSGQETTE